MGKKPYQPKEEIPHKPYNDICGLISNKLSNIGLIVHSGDETVESARQHYMVSLDCDGDVSNVIAIHNGDTAIKLTPARPTLMITESETDIVKPGFYTLRGMSIVDGQPETDIYNTAKQFNNAITPHEMALVAGETLSRLDAAAQVGIKETDLCRILTEAEHMYIDAVARMKAEDTQQEITDTFTGARADMCKTLLYGNAPVSSQNTAKFSRDLDAMIAGHMAELSQEMLDRATAATTPGKPHDAAYFRASENVLAGDNIKTFYDTLEHDVKTGIVFHTAAEKMASASLAGASKSDFAAKESELENVRSSLATASRTASVPDDKITMQIAQCDNVIAEAQTKLNELYTNTKYNAKISKTDAEQQHAAFVQYVDDLGYGKKFLWFGNKEPTDEQIQEHEQWKDTSASCTAAITEAQRRKAYLTTILEDSLRPEYDRSHDLIDTVQCLQAHSPVVTSPETSDSMPVSMYRALSGMKLKDEAGAEIMSAAELLQQRITADTGDGPAIVRVKPSDGYEERAKAFSVLSNSGNASAGDTRISDEAIQKIVNVPEVAEDRKVHAYTFVPYASEPMAVVRNDLEQACGRLDTYLTLLSLDKFENVTSDILSQSENYYEFKTNLNDWKTAVETAIQTAPPEIQNKCDHIEQDINACRTAFLNYEIVRLAESNPMLTPEKMQFTQETIPVNTYGHELTMPQYHAFLRARSEAAHIICANLTDNQQESGFIAQFKPGIDNMTVSDRQQFLESKMAERIYAASNDSHQRYGFDKNDTDTFTGVQAFLRSTDFTDMINGQYPHPIAVVNPQTKESTLCPAYAVDFNSTVVDLTDPIACHTVKTELNEAQQAFAKENGYPSHTIGTMISFMDDYVDMNQIRLRIHYEDIAMHPDELRVTMFHDGPQEQSVTSAPAADNSAATIPIPPDDPFATFDQQPAAVTPSVTPEMPSTPRMNCGYSAAAEYAANQTVDANINSMLETASIELPYLLHSGIDMRSAAMAQDLLSDPAHQSWVPSYDPFKAHEHSFSEEITASVPGITPADNKTQILYDNMRDALIDVIRTANPSLPDEEIQAHYRPMFDDYAVGKGTRQLIQHMLDHQLTVSSELTECATAYTKAFDAFENGCKQLRVDCTMHNIAELASDPTAPFTTGQADVLNARLTAVAFDAYGGSRIAPICSGMQTDKQPVIRMDAMNDLPPEPSEAPSPSPSDVKDVNEPTDSSMNALAGLEEY